MTLKFVCSFVFFPLLLWFFVFMQFYPLTHPAVGDLIDLLELLLKVCFPASYSFYKRSVYFLLSEFWTDQENHVVEDHPFSFFYFFLVLFWESELSGHMRRESHK